MSTEDKSQQRIEKALDTLTELCDTPEDAVRDSDYTRKSAAEEILRHYREERLMKNLVVTLNVNGAVPVRPMTRTEMES